MKDMHYVYSLISLGILEIFLFKIDRNQREAIEIAKWVGINCYGLLFFSYLRKYNKKMAVSNFLEVIYLFFIFVAEKCILLDEHTSLFYLKQALILSIYFNRNFVLTKNSHILILFSILLTFLFFYIFKEKNIKIVSFLIAKSDLINISMCLKFHIFNFLNSLIFESKNNLNFLLLLFFSFILFHFHYDLFHSHFFKIVFIFSIFDSSFFFLPFSFLLIIGRKFNSTIDFYLYFLLKLYILIILIYFKMEINELIIFILKSHFFISLFINLQKHYFRNFKKISSELNLMKFHKEIFLFVLLLIHFQYFFSYPFISYLCLIATNFDKIKKIKYLKFITLITILSWLFVFFNFDVCKFLFSRIFHHTQKTNFIIKSAFYFSFNKQKTKLLLKEFIFNSLLEICVSFGQLNLFYLMSRKSQICFFKLLKVLNVCLKAFIDRNKFYFFPF